MTTTTDDVAVLREHGQRLYTIPKLSKLIGVSDRAIRNWVDSGELRTIRPGRNIYIVESDAWEFLYGSKAVAAS